MANPSALLDTSFFLRLLNEYDPLVQQAEGYFRYFQQERCPMLVSTVSLAEYCVKGTLDDLPMRNLQVLPFNVTHAVQAGKFAAAVFRSKGRDVLTQRSIIPNDTKLFAQADWEQTISYYLTSDEESYKVYGLFTAAALRPRFQFINLRRPHTEVFGTLGL